MAAMGIRTLPPSPGALAGFVELWLRGTGAKRMGPEAQPHWRQVVRAGASPPPTTLRFSLVGKDFALDGRIV